MQNSQKAGSLSRYFFRFAFLTLGYFMFSCSPEDNSIEPAILDTLTCYWRYQHGERREFTDEQARSAVELLSYLAEAKDLQLESEGVKGLAQYEIFFQVPETAKHEAMYMIQYFIFTGTRLVSVKGRSKVRRYHMNQYLRQRLDRLFPDTKE